MARIISFVDGMTSASAPDLTDAGNETYALTNNQSSFTNITSLVLTGYSSVVGFIEIERIGSATYRQVIQINFTFDGTSWSIELGSYDGDDLIQASSITETQHILLAMSGDQVQYKTGNLASHTSSKLKVNLTRFTA